VPYSTSSNALLLPPPYIHDRYAALPDLHSFPTRRSSDLWERLAASLTGRGSSSAGSCAAPASASRCIACSVASKTSSRPGITTRSEEHTSELQSRFDLVCRLLLEKKEGKVAERKEHKNRH